MYHRARPDNSPVDPSGSSSLEQGPVALDEGVSRFGPSKRLPTPYLGEESNNQRATELGGSPISSHLGLFGEQRRQR